MCHSTIQRKKTLGTKTEEADGGDTILSETKIGPLFPLARQILKPKFASSLICAKGPGCR
jgi:hypothetical protein